MRYDNRKIEISERTEGMVNSSADYYQESDLFFYLMNAKALGYDFVNEKIDSLALQLSPLTATWGLIYWEASVALPMQPNVDYELRRPKVLARLQNYENFGAPMIRRIAEGYGQKIRVYIEPGESLVTVVFQRGVPTFLESFKEAVDNIIHAHLGTEYKFEYIIEGGLTAIIGYKVYGYSVRVQLLYAVPFLTYLRKGACIVPAWVCLGKFLTSLTATTNPGRLPAVRYLSLLRKVVFTVQ